MPLYDFSCKRCGHQTEFMVKMSERDTAHADTPCPKCGDKALQPIISGNHAFMSPEAIGRIKAPADFRNFLSQVAKNNPGNSIRQR